jgi:hypothetical protein
MSDEKGDNAEMNKRLRAGRQPKPGPKAKPDEDETMNGRIRQLAGHGRDNSEASDHS